jgi:large subunit ribosomal protein L3
VFKGLKMAGQHGATQVTVRNLEVVRVDTERNLLLVHGSVPGHKNQVVMVRDSDRTATIGEQA